MVAALLLAACARLPLPGVSTADAAPKLIPKSRVPAVAGHSADVAASADHTDGLRSFGGTSRMNAFAGNTAAATTVPFANESEIAIGSTALRVESDAPAGAGSSASAKPAQSESALAMASGVGAGSMASANAATVAGAEKAQSAVAMDGRSAAAGEVASPISDTADGTNAFGTGGAPGSASSVASGAVAQSSGAVSAKPPPARAPGPAARDAALHPVAATVVPGALGAGTRADQVNERAKWWLTGIGATLLLLFFAGCRKKRPQRVMKMNTHRAAPVGSPRPSTLPDLRATEKPRVRMFSAHEVYAPTHDSHHGPWEAPVNTERGFAHRYELGDEVSEGLLFVGEPGSEAHDAGHDPDPAAFAATVTLPAGYVARPSVGAAEPVDATPQGTLRPPTVPLVFSSASMPQPDATHAQAPADEPAPAPAHVAFEALAPVQSSAMPAPEAAVVRSMPDPAALLPVEAAIAAIGAIAIERDAPVVQAALVVEMPFAQQLEEERPIIETAVALETGTAPPAGAAMLNPAELGLTPGAPREPASETQVGALAAPAAVQTPAAAPVSAAPRRDHVTEAGRLVDSGDYAAALVHLDEALQNPNPSADVWVLSALCWWQIARADGGSKAYANAADAMERLLERDPSQTDLWYRTGSCRLLQAGGERGAAQRATLDLAVAALRRAAPEGGQGDPLRTATLGDALSERALAATDEPEAARAKRMSEAVHVLRDAARVARDPASMASWKLQQALQALASLLSSTDASKVRLEAEAVLAAGVGSANEQDRLSWYAARVENELAHAELAEGATRALHLRTFRENYRDVLTGPDAAPELLLSWLELLALETGHLRGDAARSRFDEGEAILNRLDAMLPGNAHVALARARLLRRRAAQSNALSRRASLSDAIAGLIPLVERGDAPQLQIEAVELMLDRAACVPSAQTAEDYARAEKMASGLLQHPAFAMAAARCVLQARLGQSSGTIDPDVCNRLEALAGNDVRSRWLLAQAALRNGSPREACGHCEAAARSGVRLDQAMVQLWDQASRKWSATLHGQKDAAWLVNKQSLRSAG